MRGRESSEGQEHEGKGQVKRGDSPPGGSGTIGCGGALWVETWPLIQEKGDVEWVLSDMVVCLTWYVILHCLRIRSLNV